MKKILYSLFFNISCFHSKNNKTIYPGVCIFFGNNIGHLPNIFCHRLFINFSL
ncbi:hypothetical protein B4168_2218 [Anoxybacillus flavithermus]|nr:hypothetical protein B4168_2218 [Anoxybacillus flavithermus]OAO85873.1 hypothetical protein GT23_2776 [Parageobacillus thermoglucosidasius]